MTFNFKNRNREVLFCRRSGPAVTHNDNVEKLRSGLQTPVALGMLSSVHKKCFI